MIRVDDKEMDIIIRLSESIATLNAKAEVLSNKVDELETRIKETKDESDEAIKVATEVANHNINGAKRWAQVAEDIRSVIWYLFIPFLLYLISKYWK